MHCVDLGVFANAAGGILYMEMSNNTLHKSFADGVDWLNKELARFYSARVVCRAPDCAGNSADRRRLAESEVKSSRLQTSWALLGLLLTRLSIRGRLSIGRLPKTCGEAR